MLLAKIVRMQLLVNHGHSFGDCRSSYLAGLAAFVMKMEQLPHISESPRADIQRIYNESDKLELFPRVT
jgi:hypothetical protein